LTRPPDTRHPKPGTFFEPLVVLGATLGPFIYMSFHRLRVRAGGDVIPVTNRALVLSLSIQVLLALVVGAFLYRRGWRVRQVSLPLEPRDGWRALGIMLAVFAINALSHLALYLASPVTAAEVSAVHFSGAVSGWMIALAVLIDPVFEEALFLGYTITALERYGLPFAALASVGLRALVHAYQGPLAVVTIAPWGAVFLYFYLRRRSIWPIVLAHAGIDTIALLLTNRFWPG